MFLLCHVILLLFVFITCSFAEIFNSGGTIASVMSPKVIGWAISIIFAIAHPCHKRIRGFITFTYGKLGIGKVVIATGGTSDIPVAEEAALTAQVLGSEVVRLYDVGVSGVHRLLAHMDSIMEASVVVAIAGMEGALASVVGGLAECPVIAVPTSVGYGASFGGVAALLSMLNSCASGVSVVNIDNGFGAGYLANMINHMEVKG